MKTYPYKGKTLIRVESECKCLGCYFMDEETADCFAPMSIKLGDVDYLPFFLYCIDKKDEYGDYKCFQFREAEKQD